MRLAYSSRQKRSAIGKERGILFHSDAIQAFGKMPLNVNDMGIDLLS